MHAKQAKLKAKRKVPAKVTPVIGGATKTLPIGKPFERKGVFGAASDNDAEWVRAPELGIRDLTALPEDMMQQTGESRFAAEDLQQGGLGDCWLISAMSLAALKPELLEKIFEKTPVTRADGQYIVQLFINGAWIEIPVDDRLPSRNGQLLYCHSKGGDELWPSLLEKAYAKYYDSYRLIDGGHCHVGLVTFSGGVGELIMLQGKGAIDPEAVWPLLQQHLDSGNLVGAGSIPGDDRYARRFTIFPMALYVVRYRHS